MVQQSKLIKFAKFFLKSVYVGAGLFWGFELVLISKALAKKVIINIFFKDFFLYIYNQITYKVKYGFN